VWRYNRIKIENEGYCENGAPFLLSRRSEMSVFFLAKNQKGSDTHAPSKAGTTGAFPSAAITEVIQETNNHQFNYQKEKR